MGGLVGNVSISAAVAVINFDGIRNGRDAIRHCRAVQQWLCTEIIQGPESDSVSVSVLLLLASAPMPKLEL